MHALMSMGQGDEIALVDADFPAATYSQRLIRAVGVELLSLLEAILPLFPLDSFVKQPVAAMDWHDWSDTEPSAYQRCRETLSKHSDRFTDYALTKRYDFYTRASEAYAVVITAEADGNLILKKAPIMI